MTKQDFIALLRYSTIGLLFLVLLMPLTVADGSSFPNLFFPFITGKNFVFRLLVELAGAGWVILSLFDAQYRPKKTALAWAIGIFIIVIGIADIFGENPFKSFFSNYERSEGFVTIVHLAVYFFVASRLLITETLWTAFFNTSIGVSVMTGIFGLIQLAHSVERHGDRLDSTFGNSAYFGLYMMFHVLITALVVLQMWKRAPKRQEPWLRTFGVYLPIVLLQLLMLYYAATRGPILGLIGGVFIVGLLIAITERQNKKLRVVAGSLVGAAIVLVLAFIGLRHTSFVQSSPVLNRFASISLSDPTTQSRFIIWNMAYQGFKERPLLGWGQENFNYVFNKYYNPVIYNQEQWFDRSHNIFFDWLIAGGVLGLLSYLAIFVTALYVLWRKTDLSSQEKSIITAVFAGYFFQNFFVFDNLTSYVVFFTLLGYIQFHATNTVPAKSKEIELSEGTQYAVACLTLIAVVAAIYFFVGVPMYAASRLIDALAPISTVTGHERDKLDAFKDVIDAQNAGTYEAREQLFQAGINMVQSKSAKDVVKDYVAYAMDQGQEQLKETPDDARYFYLYGTFLQQIGDYKDSLLILQRAHELSPAKQPITMTLGSTYFALGDKDKALETFKSAYEIYPQNDDAKKTYALVAMYANHFEIVQALFGTGPVMDERFLRAYRETKQYDLMIAYLENDFKTKQSLDSGVSLGLGYWIVGNRTQALAVFKAALAATTDATAQKQIQAFITDLNAGKPAPAQ